MESEIKFYKTLVDTFLTSKQKFSTKNFWNRYSIKLPLLTQLAKLLINVPASSAFIERFFSICGVICKDRAGNSDDDLIITRSLLQVNIEILNSFNEYAEDDEQVD